MNCIQESMTSVVVMIVINDLLERILCADLLECIIDLEMKFIYFKKVKIMVVGVLQFR